MQGGNCGAPASIAYLQWGQLLSPHYYMGLAFNP